MERKLAVILAADVAGFSRLVAVDEEATLLLLSKYRATISDLIDEHGGRLFGAAGDGFVAEFASAVQAVRAGVAMQRAIGRYNADLVQQRRMEFRIGIHLGDVVVDGSDLLGDGVNIAARLEEIAEPSGLCISGPVWEQIEGKLGFPVSSLGERILKNIPRPVRTYDVEWRMKDSDPADVLEGLPDLPDKPSVAVLPFTNMSGDEEQEYFADGITEEIITALSRTRWFFVIARNSTFTYKGRAVSVKQVARELGVRYVLEGSVRKSGSRIRVTGQLIDAESGAHLWADRFDHDHDDIFAIQDQITERVVGAIEPEIVRGEGTRAAHRIAANPQAYDCFMRGMWHFHQFSAEESSRAEEWMRKAIGLDPYLSQGYTGLARLVNGRIWFGWSADIDGDVQEAYDAAKRAVELDGTDAYAHYILSFASLNMGRHEQALAEAQRAVDLNPNLALAHCAVAWVRTFIGHFAQAVDPLLRCIRLSPSDPLQFVFLYFLALVNYHRGDYEQAIRLVGRGLTLRRIYALQELLAASLAQAGRLDEAAHAQQEMEKLKPVDYERYWNVTHPYADAGHRDHLLAGLRKIGVDG